MPNSVKYTLRIFKKNNKKNCVLIEKYMLKYIHFDNLYLFIKYKQCKINLKVAHLIKGK